MPRKTYFVEFRDRRNRDVIVEEHAADAMSAREAAIQVAGSHGWFARELPGPDNQPLYATKAGMPACSVHVRGPFR